MEIVRGTGVLPGHLSNWPQYHPCRPPLIHTSSTRDFHSPLGGNSLLPSLNPPAFLLLVIASPIFLWLLHDVLDESPIR